jgi:hypothetical protein
VVDREQSHARITRGVLGDDVAGRVDRAVVGDDEDEADDEFEDEDVPDDEQDSEAEQRPARRRS